MINTRDVNIGMIAAVAKRLGELRGKVVFVGGCATGLFVTDPYLRLFDLSGRQLAENDNYWSEDAEIWWWNSGSDQIVFVEASEANGEDGCGFAYTLEVVPWSPEEFRSRFGK